MTRHEFINYAITSNPLEKDKPKTTFLSYDRKKLELEIQKKYKSEFNSKKILDFFENIGIVKFKRMESVSGDILKIELRWLAYIYHWKDIGTVVNRIGYIENCSGIIKVLYMSEDSKFYDHDHNLLANNEEQFFDYLTSTEFDFHPVIKKRVFDVLYESGWYEGRHIDVIEFSKKMKQLDILLSQEQLDFLSEFSNISFSFESEFCHFYSLEQILLKNKLKSTLLTVSNDKTPEQNVFEIGETFSGPLHIDSKGILRFMGIHMMGRTAFECVNHLVKDVFEWDTEPDESENNDI